MALYWMTDDGFYKDGVRINGPISELVTFGSVKVSYDSDLAETHWVWPPLEPDLSAVTREIARGG